MSKSVECSIKVSSLLHVHPFHAMMTCTVLWFRCCCFVSFFGYRYNSHTRTYRHNRVLTFAIMSHANSFITQPQYEPRNTFFSPLASRVVGRVECLFFCGFSPDCFVLFYHTTSTPSTTLSQTVELIRFNF